MRWSPNQLLVDRADITEELFSNNSGAAQNQCYRTFATRNQKQMIFNMYVDT